MAPETLGNKLLGLLGIACCSYHPSWSRSASLVQHGGSTGGTLSELGVDNGARQEPKAVSWGTRQSSAKMCRGCRAVFSLQRVQDIVNGKGRAAQGFGLKRVGPESRLA